MTEEAIFDAIVVGSGITGGLAAKELTERGLKVLMIERGPMIEHQSGYKKETTPPWELPFMGQGDSELYTRDYYIQSKKKQFFHEWSQDHFVNDRLNPYDRDPARPFDWYRGYQLGGRSLTWGRQCYRWSDLDFRANAHDGNGTDWPLRYADLERWYGYIEDFIGVSGSKENLAQLPDGHFQPPMPLNAGEQLVKCVVEKHWPDRRVIIGRSSNITRSVGDRAPCQYRGVCNRGCSYGAYFSTQSSTLPAAMATGRITVITDTVVSRLIYDPATNRVTGVETVGTDTLETRTFTARLIFLNASTINTCAIMLRSTSERFPKGLANSSGVLGRYLMDHASCNSAQAVLPGLDDRNYFGNRPNNAIVPRFRNVGEAEQSGFVRGYCFQGGAIRRGWKRGGSIEGVGAALKKTLHGPGDWVMTLGVFAECLPNADNRVVLHPTKTDAQGLAQVSISFSYGSNEMALLRDAEAEAVAMLEAAGGRVIARSNQPDPGGSSIHEMGGARMGRDPSTSVLNAFSQTHDVPNLFVTDGAQMASSACQNPSLTYMALTARACERAVALMKEGSI